MRIRTYPDVILDAGDGDAFLVTISDESMRTAFRRGGWISRPSYEGTLWSSPETDTAPYRPDGEVSDAVEALFAAPVVLEVGEVGEAEHRALSWLSWRADLGGWLFLAAPEAEYDRYSAETTVTVVEAGGERWTTRLPTAVIGDQASLEAAISGDLHDVHPENYVESWKSGDPLPTLEGACVHVGDELAARLTNAVVVGVGTVPVRESEAGGPGYLIYRPDRPFWSGNAVAWYADEPGPDMVALHTGTAGGVVERLSDGVVLSPEFGEPITGNGADGP